MHASQKSGVPRIFADRLERTLGRNKEQNAIPVLEGKTEIFECPVHVPEFSGDDGKDRGWNVLFAGPPFSARQKFFCSDPLASAAISRSKTRSVVLTFGRSHRSALLQQGESLLQFTVINICLSEPCESGPMMRPYLDRPFSAGDRAGVIA